MEIFQSSQQSALPITDSITLIVISLFTVIISLITILTYIKIRSKRKELEQEVILLTKTKHILETTQKPDEIIKKKKFFGGILGVWIEICSSYYSSRLISPLNALKENMESYLEKGDAKIRFQIGSLTMIGLLGTFTGLIITVINAFKMVKSAPLNSANSTGDFSTLGDLLTQILGALSGMEVAFSTSILGLAFSIILGWIFSKYRGDREWFYNEMTALASKTLIPLFSPSVDTLFEKEVKETAAQFTTLLEEFRNINATYTGDLHKLHEEGIKNFEATYSKNLMADLTALKEWSLEHSKLLKEEMSEVIRKIPQQFDSLKDNLKNISSDIVVLILSIDKLKDEIGNIINSYKESISEMSKVTGDMEKKTGNIESAFRKSLEDIFRELEVWAERYMIKMNEKTMHGVDKVVSHIDEVHYRTSSYIQELTASVNKQSFDLNKAVESIKIYTISLKEISGVFNETNRDIMSTMKSASHSFEQGNHLQSISHKQNTLIKIITETKSSLDMNLEEHIKGLSQLINSVGEINDFIDTQKTVKKWPKEVTKKENMAERLKLLHEREL